MWLLLIFCISGGLITFYYFNTIILLYSFILQGVITTSYSYSVITFPS